MKATVRVLCTPATAPGFALTSLPVAEAEDGAEAGARLAELRREPGVGVALVEDTLYDALPEETLRSLAVEPLPMVVPFPGPVWIERPPTEAYIVELLRRAIGYRVRLR